MKAHELIKILVEHPDFIVGFKCMMFGGLDEELKETDIDVCADFNTEPAKDAYFLLTPPYQMQDYD